MNRYMKIMTPYRDFFIVDLETGNMTQYHFDTKPENHHFSGGWKLKGLTHVKRNEFIPLSVIKNTPEVLDKISLTYKNGNPQYTVVDLDHGTTRMWGNTKVHGILSLSLI